MRGPRPRLRPAAEVRRPGKNGRAAAAEALGGGHRSAQARESARRGGARLAWLLGQGREDSDHVHVLPTMASAVQRGRSSSPAARPSPPPHRPCWLRAGRVQAVVVNPADFQQVDARQGRRRDGRADGAGGAAGPLGAAHRPQRHAAPHRRRTATPRVDRHASRSTPTTRRACRASASTRASPPTGASTSTTRRRCPPRPATRRPPARNWSAWQGVNRLSRFTLNADFTLNTGSQVDRPRRAGRPGHVLPRRRRHRLRRGRQPLPVHRRRHQPVRLGRLRADRRADQPQPGVRRAAQRRPTPTTCAARCCGSR